MGKVESYDEMVEGILKENPEIERIGKENQVRRMLSATFLKVQEEQGLTLEAFAEKAHISVSQARRLLHLEQGGQLWFSTIVRACMAYGISPLQVDVRVK